MKTRSAKSISMDDGLWFELQKESHEQGIPLSQLIEDRCKGGVTPDDEGVGSKEIILNKYLILNNKLILLAKQYNYILDREIRVHQEAEKTLKREKEEQNAKIQQDLDKIKAKFSTKTLTKIAKILPELPDFKQKVLEIMVDSKEKFGIRDVLEYHRLTKILKELS